MADVKLQLIINTIKNNIWHDLNYKSDSELESFYILRNKLTLNSTEDVVLRGTRIALPATLHKQAIELAHKCHQGVVRTNLNNSYVT